MDSSSTPPSPTSPTRTPQQSLLEENRQLKETIRWLEQRVLSLERQTSTSRPRLPPAKWSKRNRHPSDDVDTQLEDKINKEPDEEEHAGLKHRKSPAAASPPKLRSIPNLNDVLSLKKSLENNEEDDDEEEGHPFLSSSKVVSTPETSLATSFFDDDMNTISFFEQVKDRGMWLVGLLLLQSLSSFIIRRNEDLLQHHIIIVQFLTMLVGAGGNGGNQASVKVIRGLAVGEIHNGNLKNTILQEISMGMALAVILGCAGALRAAIFSVPLMETLAITMSLVIIVFISVVLGALLPIAMKYVGLDPAHSSTTIQVLMDILGVTITVHVSSMLLDSVLGAGIIQALTRDDEISMGNHL